MARGNRIAEFTDANSDDAWSSSEAGVEYTWDHRNRLTQVTFKNGPSGAATQIIHYTYDAFNQLVKRVEDADGAGTSAPIDQTFYLYDQGQVALEFHQSGSGDLDAEDLTHRYLWGPAVDQLLADEQVDFSDTDADGEVLWALTDHLGSVRDVVDSNGDLRIRRAYDSFGNRIQDEHFDTAGDPVSSSDPEYVDVAFEFTGRYFDEATGLQNNLNRWYDPAIGRWISEDPIGFAGKDVNLYRYVGNSPVISVDPDGLKTKGGKSGPKEKGNDDWLKHEPLPDGPNEMHVAVHACFWSIGGGLTGGVGGALIGGGTSIGADVCPWVIDYSHAQSRNDLRDRIRNIDPGIHLITDPKEFPGGDPDEDETPPFKVVR